MVCPISSTLASECLRYFNLSMHTRARPDGSHFHSDPFADVDLFIPRDQVFELIDHLEKHFNVEFYDTPFIPSIYDRLATMNCSVMPLLLVRDI